MACLESAAFSDDGKHFCCCGNDGKLKIWNTDTGVLKQEYTPNLHLISPTTCVTWLSLSRKATSSKKKRRSRTSWPEGAGNDADVIALGTVNGAVLLYSVAVGDVEAQLQGGHNERVACLSWASGCPLYSGGADGHLVEWDIGHGAVKSKWKAGNEQLSSLLVLPDGKTILSASRTISWWNVEDKQLIKTFSGHSTNIISLSYIPPASEEGDTYFMSAAKGDRYVSAWSLNPVNRSKTPVASFIMEDIAISLSVYSSVEAQQTTACCVTRSGVLHVYRHQLNGKSQKPIKPKVTVQIASDTGQSKESVLAIPIVAAKMSDENTILIAHGNMAFLSFEKIVPNCYEKLLCLVRQDPRQSATVKEAAASKVKIPKSENDVQYLQASQTSSMKRGRRVQSEVPMEERLENLQLNKPEPSHRPPRGDSLAHLLMQGLHSKDKKLLHNALFRRDDKIIMNTVTRLPIQVVVPLVKELTVLIQGKSHVSQIAVQWLKATMAAHASLLLANPELIGILSPVLGQVEARLNFLAPLSRLRGRLELLVGQLDGGATGSDAAEQGQGVALEESLLVYQDTDSSEEVSEAEDEMLNSDSDRWDELSEDDAVTADDSEVQGEELDVTEMSS